MSSVVDLLVPAFKFWIFVKFCFVCCLIQNFLSSERELCPLVLFFVYPLLLKSANDSSTWFLKCPNEVISSLSEGQTVVPPPHQITSRRNDQFSIFTFLLVNNKYYCLDSIIIFD